MNITILRKSLYVSLGSLLLFLCAVPFVAFGANAGFVSGIWYSKFPFFAGDTVRVYAGIQNRSGGDLKGTASFFVDGVPLGTVDFSAVHGGFIEIWSDWKASEGKHTVTAKVLTAAISEAGKEPQPVSLDAAGLLTSDADVDNDLDHDEIGDRDDPDIDNDGLSNVEEARTGTNISRSDTDGDEIPDGEDSDPLHASEGKSSEKGAVLSEQAGLMDSSSDIIGRFKNGVSSALAWINSTAEKSGKVLGVKKEALEKKLKTENKTANGESLTANAFLSSNEDWFSRYLYLPLLSVLVFVLEHTLVLYLVLALFFFFVVKAIFRHMR